MRRGLLAAAAVAVAAARLPASPDSAATKELDDLLAWEADKLHAIEGGPSHARASRLLSATSLLSALDGCRLRPGGDHEVLFAQESCFLHGSKDGSSSPQLAKHVVRPRAPLHVAVRGPAAPDAPAGTVRVAVHDGAVTVLAKPRFASEAAMAHVRAIVSEPTKGEAKGTLVTLPYIQGAASQEWELIIRAVPESHGQRGSFIAKGDEADALGAGSAEEDADGAAIVSLTYAAAEAREHSSGELASAAAPRALGPASAPTVLSDGQPVADRVGRSRWQFYTFLQTAPLAGRIDIVVTPISGDPGAWLRICLCAQPWTLLIACRARNIRRPLLYFPFPLWRSTCLFLALFPFSVLPISVLQTCT